MWTVLFMEGSKDLNLHWNVVIIGCDHLIASWFQKFFEVREKNVVRCPKKCVTVYIFWYFHWSQFISSKKTLIALNILN